MQLFYGLNKTQETELLSSGKQKSFSAGEFLFHHGDKVKSFYIINSGNVQLLRETADGQEKTLEILKSGQTLSESEIMDSCAGHRASAKAIDNVSVTEFPAAWLKQTVRKYPEFALNLLSQIANQAHMAEVEAEHQASMSAAQLVACFLQRLCVIYDFNPKQFELPYSKTVIASRLGMELETFSRALGKLKESGIYVEGNKVKITDLEKIETYVCNFCSISGECKTHAAMESKM